MPQGRGRGQELRQGAALAFCLMLITGVNLRGMKCRKRNFECALVYPLSPKATYLPQSPCSLSPTHSSLPLSLPSFCLPTSQLSFLLPVSAFEIKNQHWPRPSPSPIHFAASERRLTYNNNHGLLTFSTITVRKVKQNC